MSDEIKTISVQESMKILGIPEEWKNPDIMNRYLVKDDPFWIAIDNTDGNCWTEDFFTEGDARAWLVWNGGRPCRTPISQIREATDIGTLRYYKSLCEKTIEALPGTEKARVMSKLSKRLAKLIEAKEREKNNA